MPTFELSGPDGGTYQIEADTAAGAVGALSSMFKQPDASGDSSLAGIGKSLGIGAAEGAISLAGLPGDVGSLVGQGVDYAGSKLGFDPNSVQRFKDTAKSALRSTPAGVFQAPGSSDIKSGIEKYTGQFYKPQGAAEDLAYKVGEFLPAMIGGPESLGAKALTRVVAPAVGSEIGKQVAGPAGEIIGGLAGAGGATAGARKFQEMVAAKRAVPTAEATISAAKGQFKAAEDMNLTVTPDFATNAAAKMRNDLKGFDPEAQGAVFKAADRLEGLAPKLAAPQIPSTATAIPAATTMQTSPAAPPSLLEFIASKGGLRPDSELEAIGLAVGHRTQIPGQRGFYSVVSNRGGNLDRIREAAEEAGYLRGQNGATSTPRDLLDKIDAELRGKKQYPIGHEGARSRRESILMSEREQAAHDSHMRQFNDALDEAGHSKISPDVRSRAVQLMDREGMSADNAVEHALLQLDQEDAASLSRGLRPPPIPGNFVHGFPPDMANGVKMNDVELIRKQLTTLKTSPDASVREAARRAILSLQESQLALAPSQVLNGEAGTYSKFLKDAIGNYAAGKRSNTVMGKVALGDLNAATAGSGANEDNALRQAIKQLVRPVNNDIVPKASRLGFNAKEIEAMNRVARGSATGNAARFVGKLAPTGIVSGGLSGGAGFAAAGPAGAVALPAVGYLAKKIGDMSTKRAVEALDRLVRSRSPLAQQVAASLPPAVVAKLPYYSKLFLATNALRPIVSPQLVPQSGQ